MSNIYIHILYFIVIFANVRVDNVLVYFCQQYSLPQPNNSFAWEVMQSQSTCVHNLFSNIVCFIQEQCHNQLQSVYMYLVLYKAQQLIC